MKARLITLALLGFALFSACSRAGEIIEHPSFEGPRTTIKYALWGGANEVVYSRAICEKFVQAHPHIRLDVNVFPWGQYWTKLQTQAASGLAPDVFSLYSGTMGVWIARGALLPLDDCVTRTGLDLSAYHRAAVVNCTWQEKLYCMPLEVPIRVLVYSRDRLEEAGIPREDWPRPDRAMSWNAFRALAARLTLCKPDGTFSQYGMAANLYWNLSLSKLYGGRYLDRAIAPTRPTVTGNTALEQALIENFQTQYGERIVLGNVPLSSGYFISGDSILMSPKFAMSMTGPWALRPLQEAGLRFGLTPLPRAGDSAQRTHVNAVGIFAHSRHVDEAWTFVRFLTSPAIQPIFGKTLKGVPALVAARQALLDNDYGVDNCEAFLVDLADAEPHIMAGNTYVPAAIHKWLSKTEQALDLEYGRRLAHLPRTDDGAIDDQVYAGFVTGMNAYVAATVRVELPRLQAELKEAFARAAPSEPSLLVRGLVPFLLCLLMVALAWTYVRWIMVNRPAVRGLSGREGAVGYWFIAPWLVGGVCFVLGPIIAATLLSFTEWNMISPPRWIGAMHYLGLANDDLFWLGIRKTALYVVLVTPISVCGGLFTAGLLTCDVRGRDLFKAIFYFPSLFTGAAVAVLWVNMFNKEYGVINRLLSWVGIASINWLDEAHAFYTVVLMNVFWIGGAMIIYYAGMKQIPRSLYEAAAMDGAGPVRKFMRITIPMLSPVILFTVIMTTIGAFQVLTPALFFAQSAAQIGEPGDALRFYSVNIYDEAFNNLRMGRACCYALILFVLIFLATMLQMKLSRRFVHTESGP